MNQDELLKKVKTELPDSPGVYIMKNVNDEVIYVGKAKSLKKRVKSYFDASPKRAKTSALVSNVDHFDYILTNSELDAFSLECNLIKEHMPKYNILLKDDKSFPYFQIDLNERFPRVQIVRRPKSKQNVLLFGPYVTGTRVSELLSLIKSAYPIRWCNTNFDKKERNLRPCLHGSIGNCLAPCVAAENEKKYDEVIQKVIEFLNGKTSDIKKQLKLKMDSFAKELKFEEALVCRNNLEIVEKMDSELITSLTGEKNIDIFAIAEQDEVYDINLMMIRSGKNVGQVNYPLTDVVGDKNDILLQFISNYYSSGENILPKEIVVKDFDEEQKEMLQVYLLSTFNKVVKVTIPKIGLKVELLDNALKNANEYLTHSKERIDKKYKMTVSAIDGLKEILGLSRLKRIECFDISHISGAYAVASMVVFENGEPAYKEYRKFKIKTVTNDDFAAMAEVLTRRLTDLVELKEGFNKRPDLIVVDGGFGQLNSAKAVMDKIGIDIPLISLAEKNEEICLLDKKEPVVLSKADYSLKLLQRVRDESHRFAITYHRDLRGKSLKSSLLEIQGVGKVKVQALIKHFKSVAAIATATEDELKKVEGIGDEFAKIIYEHFHENITK